MDRLQPAELDDIRRAGGIASVAFQDDQLGLERSPRNGQKSCAASRYSSQPLVTRRCSRASTRTITGRAVRPRRAARGAAYDLYVAANCDPDLQFAVRRQLVARDQALEPWSPPQWRRDGSDAQQRKRDRGRGQGQVFEPVGGGIVLPGPYRCRSQGQRGRGPG